MQKNYNNQYFINLPRIAQIDSSHCGPAVVEMLLSNLGLNATQEEIAEAADVEGKIEDHGMTVAEMRLAVNHLFPYVNFWHKDYATIEELRRIVAVHRYPVGVEWQGVFLQYSDGEDGHYGVITHVDFSENLIYLADPYDKFAGVDRNFNINAFLKRWWDINEVVDLQTGMVEHVKDNRMMFIITPQDETFPEELHMSKN